jgi:hypothetical protein
MLIGEIVAAAVVVTALTLALLTRRMARDDVHSVEGYHRSIHTLESINAHPAVPMATIESDLGATTVHSESAVRVVGTPPVRVTDAPSSAAPSGRPLPVMHHDAPLLFDDAGPSTPPVTHDLLVNRDKAMGSINHRPRRLAAPATAVAVVIVLVIVLLLTGSHAVAPQPRHHGGRSGKSATSHSGSNAGGTTTANTTSTTSPPVVVPQSGTSRGATYAVPGSTFTLAFSATSGSCWVDATNSTSGATLFTGTLQPGQQHSLVASGPVTVVLGAPTVLAVSVNGGAVALPSRFQSPFTMKFTTAS